MKLHLIEQTKGIYVAEVWPTKLPDPITVSIIESLGEFTPYVEGQAVAKPCQTLEDTVIKLTEIVENKYGVLQIIARTDRDYVLSLEERFVETETPLKTLIEKDRTARQVSSRPLKLRQNSSLIALSDSIQNPSLVHFFVQVSTNNIGINIWSRIAVIAGILVVIGFLAGGGIYAGAIVIPKDASVANIFAYQLNPSVFYTSLTPNRKTSSVLQTVSAKPEVSDKAEGNGGTAFCHRSQRQC